MHDFTIIGAGILDILARPVNASVFQAGSVPARDISLTFGGDALNESIILSRLGKRIQLISTTGADDAGHMIIEYCKKNGILADHIIQSPDYPTGTNIVLVDEKGERSFVTCPASSLRKLSMEHIDTTLFAHAPILCFASIFVFPLLGPPELTAIFQEAKKSGCVVCADMTKCKNRETLNDLSEALPYVDYIFPNYEEACMVTRLTDPDEIADAFLLHGVGHVVIKLGKKGCLIKTKEERLLVPAFPHASCIDTTGAGDNFAAGFLYALSEGMDLRSCGCFANAAASIAIETVGATTGVQSLEQILERIPSILSLI